MAVALPLPPLTVQLAFHISSGGSHSGSQACLATSLTTELSPRTPATILPEVPFPISTWQGTQASCLLLSGRISRWKRERIERQPFLLLQYLPWGQASWALSLREEAAIYFFNVFLGIILDVEGSCRNVQIIHVSPTPSLTPIIACYVTTEIVKTRKLAG